MQDPVNGVVGSRRAARAWAVAAACGSLLIPALAQGAISTAVHLHTTGTVRLSADLQRPSLPSPPPARKTDNLQGPWTHKVALPLLQVLAQVPSHPALAAQRLPIIVQTAGSFQPAMERQFLKLGGTVKTRYTIINGFSGTIPARALHSLASMKWVLHVSADATVKKLQGPAESHMNPPAD